MKNIFKNLLVGLNTVIIFLWGESYFIDLFCATKIHISDPMFLKALNNSMNYSQNNFVKKSEKNSRKIFDQKKVDERENFQEIFEEDIPNVLRLKADNMDILDISGIEHFTSIISTIDLSNNNISDISPLFMWVKNKKEVLAEEDKKLRVNIFLGGNNRLFDENYTQIYELLKMSDHIYIYDSQRNGEGIVELPGFVNGRPVEQTKFDGDLSETDQSFSKTIVNQSATINTGKNFAAIHIFVVLILGICLILFFKHKSFDK